jgi:hypothetical protein
MPIPLLSGEAPYAALDVLVVDASDGFRAARLDPRREVGTPNGAIALAPEGGEIATADGVADDTGARRSDRARLGDRDERPTVLRPTTRARDHENDGRGRLHDGGANLARCDDERTFAVEGRVHARTFG